MKIALATPSFPATMAHALQYVDKFAADAAARDARIICFPESYLPGYPAIEYRVPKATEQELQQALQKVKEIAAQHNIAIIIPMDWYEGDRFLNTAQVISPRGEWLGYQTKINSTLQKTPSGSPAPNGICLRWKD